MSKSYSKDLRDRVASFVVSGGTCREAAERFGVGVATAVRWSQRLRATGSAAARPMGGVRRAVLAGERDWLLARIAEKRDLTLRAIAAELSRFATERGGKPQRIGNAVPFFLGELQAATALHIERQPRPVHAIRQPLGIAHQRSSARVFADTDENALARGPRAGDRAGLHLRKELLVDPFRCAA